MDPSLALIAEFFLKGIAASHVLWALFVANNGNLDVTIRLRGWRVQDWYDAHPAGRLTQAKIEPPEGLRIE